MTDDVSVLYIKSLDLPAGVVINDFAIREHAIGIEEDGFYGAGFLNLLLGIKA